ncbi:helix-turn-helix and ligand-binding sensor domain-containing protein [Alkalitalea saponilacus]|uniref:Y_Y_Y domain-containing protein n=1 Tax=Alkalitalea saponilacus TaxID=889453 RepID=A0A1T5D938_9BACT|nr:triple tyrosine motif-containing protein [Alkalitalea saponilacus]SKB68073.1 Y_Y_Y domain-containing protein [Alkalitalea saponilacus]
MKSYRFKILLLFCLVYPAIILATEVVFLGIPEIEYFNRRQYKGGTQNWQISQAESGIIYAANNDGILEYDGTTWRLLTRVVDVIVRSVLAHEDKIYMGAYNEFGYYFKNNRNEFEYKSLSVNDEISALGDVWNIIPYNNMLIFQADKGLVLYRDDQDMQFVPARSRISNAFLVNGIIMVYDEEAGLMELRNNNLFVVSGGEQFAGIGIGTILPLSDREVLIGTISEGLFVWDYQQFKPWETPAAEIIANANVFCGTNYDSEFLIFGTIQSGVIVTDINGNVQLIANKDRGLQNNTVLGLDIDFEGNIWAGLDNGIARINYNSTISFIHGYYDIGTGYTMEKFQNNIYLGTNQALYHISNEDFRNPEKNRDDFTRIPGTSGQVWSLFVDKEGRLLCGHNNGVFEIYGSNAQPITPASVMGAWIFRYPPNRDDILLVGSYSGILILRKDRNNWVFDKRLNGFSESARYMEWDSDGSLWVTHGYLGIFRLYFNDDYTEVDRVEEYSEARGMVDNAALNVSLINGEPLFSSIHGIYGYDNSSASFYRHYLNRYFINEEYPVVIQQDQYNNIWFFTTEGVGVLRRLEDGSYTRVVGPFYPVHGRLVNGFEFLKILDERNAIIGVEDGFAHYSVNERKNFMKPFHVHIRGFRNHDESVTYYLAQPNGEQKQVPEWPYSKNSFEVTYSATTFENSNVRYSTYIEGIDSDWSAWTSQKQRQFTNIREGKYTFWVKAVNIHGVESDPIGFIFIVNPPWIRTTTAKVLYVFVVILLLLGSWILMNRLMERSKMLEKRRQQEKFRIREEQLRNAALENEKEMIRLRNEKLRNEMMFKEKELANSTMNIIHKNEFLLKVKEELARVSKQRDFTGMDRKVKDIIRKIDKDIDNDSHWEVFELHLEQVHEDFLKRLHEKFPDLSSKEKKLSAYLRMDMTSKEISSLLNISVRAVENNRYKLRKKLGLEGGDNLIDFIMNI